MTEVGIQEPPALIDETTPEVIMTERPVTSEKDSLDKHEQYYLEKLELRKNMLKLQHLDKKSLSPSYYSNSPKEKLILQYIDNFNRQYSQLYPGRKELLLTVPNEFGTNKFVCTTIRPTQLPYKELYDYRSAASFVADFISYEPLMPPHELPKTLHSPTYTLGVQSGNCFDMSMVLTSLLCGVGYNAFVISGYATRSITLMDQTKIGADKMGPCLPLVDPPPTFPQSSKATLDDVLPSPSKYRVKPQRQLRSNFLAKQEERRVQLNLAHSTAQAPVPGGITNIPDDEDEDELKGLRIHAWVLVLPGKREISEAFFIETSTGKIYSTDSELYLGLENLPPSWVDRLTISKEQFEMGSPSGTKITSYKDAKWETFAQYHRDDGMVLRVTYFGSNASTTSQIHEFYENRRDKLYRRIRIPDIKKVHEMFRPGRASHGLKEHILVDSETTEMHFYSNARSDGLVKRVMEYFTECEDRLVYRSITYDVDDGIRGSVLKMAEKFSKSPGSSIYIRVVYHLEKGRIIASMNEFRKPASDQKGQSVELTDAFEVDPYAKPPKKQQLFIQLSDLLRAEQACTQAIKSAERELADILQLRQAEEREVNLTISVYDTLRNNTTILTEDGGKDTHKNVEEEAKATDIDYLTPFLINYKNPDNLGRDDALAVKDACLKSLKERLIEKANIIQGRLDEVTTEYQKRQLAYSRNADSMTVEETDDYVSFCNDALFRIHILEKRLVKHKETAPEKYIELDGKLRADARLAKNL
ncbi:hypothetical protein BSLG_007595 [Batrachochytrium salamandrivorans]|nr:hypothetical protein BSLG_007595 [Batrachochytrium salamandrivorans]